MSKLSEIFGKIKDKWLGTSRTKQIVIAILVVGIIAAITAFGITASKTKYGVLFSNMDTNDSATIINKLKSDKVEYKVDSSTNTIYVPENQVDDLRLQYATSVKGGSVGFEVFDNSSQLGMTDQQFNVQYQRAIEGELERTIKGFPQIDNARVQIVMPDNSVFVRDGSPAKASVFLKMKSGQKLTKNQVKAIVSLVAGGVKNLSPNDVQVVDDNMTLLSSDINNNSDNQDVSATTAARSDIESKAEEELQEKVLNQLAPIYGKDRVKVQVHADMNFDSNQQTSTTISNPTVISEHETTSSSNGGSAATSGSPNDNNNNANQITNNNNSGTSTSTDTTKNYDTNRVETKTQSAPGNINRLTVSVVVDETNISAAEQASINNIVSQAAGINQQRGDSISVEGMKFDTTLQDNAQKAIDQMNQETQQQQRRKLYTEIGIGAAAAAAAIIGGVVFLVKKRRKAKAEAEAEEEETTGIDTVIDDTIVPKEQVKYDPIEFEHEDEKSHMESEIKKYASTKPDQVADVVKAWLSENER
ncbi:flagellar basal-body MS-ring/collar protein FliF [Clostridium arbusti]|uniref:flagellar basal-body MS-ring/collar protein FliF n=1 Tax=Clostridium arbusti TaxID=1137848 RepID=UPI000289E2DD|nr:flagellar basal-body MS-ring/collar protein FliF [Clostridium arbusti]